jgi:hypothetical protein
MYKKTTIKTFLIEKDKFNVMIDPNIDYAFIVALIMILVLTWLRASDPACGVQLKKRQICCRLHHKQQLEHKFG